MAILSELSNNFEDSSKVTISKVVEEIKKNYSSQAEKNAIIGEKTGEEEDKFPGKIIYNQPASKIEEAIIIEVDENLNIKENTGTGAGGGNTGNPNQNNTQATSEYTKIGSVYCNSPELSGFNPNCTYYVTYDNTGVQTSENTPISQPAPNGWYDYSSETKKWANVVTINNGNKTYWVWIPRFKYVTNSDKTTTARFVDMNDKCYMDVNDQKTEIDVSNYDISDAFTFNGKQLSGYWVSKYRVQEGTNNGTASASQDTTDQIEVDLSGFNKSNTYYVTYDDNGNQTSEDTLISNPAPNGWYDYSKKKWANVVTKNNGNITYWTYIPRYEYQIWKELKQTNIRYIKTTITQRNAETSFKVPDSFTFGGQELKGYWVSKYRVQEGTNNGTVSASQDTTDQIEVDLSGFNKLNTYYVTYDDNGNQTSEDTLISNPVPSGWYDYSKKKWANVMTNNNGLKTYWTYIPRYEYQIWKELKQTNIRYIKPLITQANVEANFKVPDAFTFGNQQLKGYWVSKYRIQDSPADTSVFNGTYYK